MWKKISNFNRLIYTRQKWYLIFLLHSKYLWYKLCNKKVLFTWYYFSLHIKDLALLLSYLNWYNFDESKTLSKEENDLFDRENIAHCYRLFSFNEQLLDFKHKLIFLFIFFLSFFFSTEEKFWRKIVSI